MYCPKCSQQQVSSSVRFCSICGFQLAAVSGLLASNGVQEPLATVSTRSLIDQKEIRLGVIMMFFSTILLLVAFVISFVFDSPYPLIAPAAGFLIGLTLVVYHILFSSRILVVPTEAREVILAAATAHLNLPPQMGIPADQFRRYDTAEMVIPPSVTDPTTKLLENDPLRLSDRS